MKRNIADVHSVEEDTTEKKAGPPEGYHYWGQLGGIIFRELCLKIFYLRSLYSLARISNGRVTRLLRCSPDEERITRFELYQDLYCEISEPDSKDPSILLLFDLYQLQLIWIKYGAMKSPNIKKLCEK